VTVRGGQVTGDGRERLAAVAFAQLAVDLHQSEGEAETLEAVLQFALHAIQCTQAGVVLLHRGKAEIGAVTGDDIATIYQWQLDRCDGPLMACIRDRQLVHVSDTATDERWPEWAAKIRGLGLRSVIHAPMVLGGRLIGVLSVYTTKPSGFEADDIAVTHILARHASVAVANTQHEQNLARAIDARKLIGQAMGILMERFDVDPDQAFAILKRYSQDNNMKLRDVAEQLIRTRRLPES
jgi:GAF domain-containing protein